MPLPASGLGALPETPLRPSSAQPMRTGATAVPTEGPRIARTSFKKRLLPTVSTSSNGAAAPAGAPMHADPSSAHSGRRAATTAAVSARTSGRALFGADDTQSSNGSSASLAAFKENAYTPKDRFGSPDTSATAAHHHHHPPPSTAAAHQHQPMPMRGTTTVTTRHPSPIQQQGASFGQHQPQHLSGSFGRAQDMKVYRSESEGRSPPQRGARPSGHSDSSDGGSVGADSDDSPSARRVSRVDSGNGPTSHHHHHLHQQQLPPSLHHQHHHLSTGGWGSHHHATTGGASSVSSSREGSLAFNSVDRRFGVMRLHGSVSAERASQQHPAHPNPSGASPMCGHRYTAQHGRRAGTAAGPADHGHHGYQHHSHGMEPSMPQSESGYSAVPVYCDYTQETTMSDTIARRYATDYFEVRELGSGHFGQVNLCRDKASGEFVAVKKLGPFWCDYDAKLFIKERTLLTHVRGASPHIMTLLASWHDGPAAGGPGEQQASSCRPSTDAPTRGGVVRGTGASTASQQQQGFAGDGGRPSLGSTRSSGFMIPTSSYTRGMPTSGAAGAAGTACAASSAAFGTGHALGYLVSPYYPHGTVADLMDFRRVRGIAWADAEVAAFIGEMAQALHALHSRSVAHVDLKPENILIDAALNYVLTDFGLAQFIDARTGRPAGGGVSGPIVRRTRESLPRGPSHQHHHSNFMSSSQPGGLLGATTTSSRLSQRADKQLFASADSQDGVGGTNSFAALAGGSNGGHHHGHGFSVGHVGPVPAGFGGVGERSASVAYSVNTMQSQDEGDCRYVSIDMLNRKQHYMAGDLFALGVSAFELLTGEPAPKNGPIHAALRSGSEEAVLEQCPCLSQRPPALVELLFALLSPDPEKIPSAFEVLRHPALMASAGAAMDAAGAATHPLPASQWLPQTRVKPEHGLVPSSAAGGGGGNLDGTPTLDATTMGMFGMSPGSPSYGAPSVVGDDTTPGSRTRDSDGTHSGMLSPSVSGGGGGAGAGHGGPDFACTPVGDHNNAVASTPQNTIPAGHLQQGHSGSQQDEDSPLSPVAARRTGNAWHGDGESDRRSAALHSIMAAGGFAETRLRKVQLDIASMLLRSQMCLVAPPAAAAAAAASAHHHQHQHQA